MRGTDWAASVLLRTLPRRPIFAMDPIKLTRSEVNILDLADRAEWELTFSASSEGVGENV